MTDLSRAAGVAPAAASTSSGRALSLPGWGGRLDSERVERDRLIAQARGSDAARQLQRCFPRWGQAFEHLSWRALVRLAKQRARRSQRPRRVAHRRRARAGGAAPPRDHAQPPPPDARGDPGADRRAGARRQRRRP